MAASGSWPPGPFDDTGPRERAPAPGHQDPEPLERASPAGEGEGIVPRMPIGPRQSRPSASTANISTATVTSSGDTGTATATSRPRDMDEAYRAGARRREGPSCIVLAAGQGTRMASRKPKVLHEVGGRPMLHHVLGTCEALEASRIVTVVGAGAHEVAQSALGFSDTCVVAVQDPPLGTAHAVQAAKSNLEDLTGDALVLYGDTPLIRAETLDEMIVERARGAAVVVLGFMPEDPGAYGRLIVGRDGTLHSIVEARDATPEQLEVPLCNAGVMAIDGALLFDLVGQIGNDNAKQEFYLTDIVAIARRQGLTCAVVEADPDEVMGVNTRDELAQAEAIFQMRKRAEVMAEGVTMLDPFTVYFSWDTVIGQDAEIGQNVIFGPGVTVEPGAVIRPWCHIEGARIASGAKVGPFARIRPGSDIGENAHIGNFVETKKAIVGEGAKINHLSYMGDVEIGPAANVGAGAITCNYDGFDKYPTEIGAGAFVGTNASLVAPVRIGDGAYTGAGSVITRNVANNALAVTRAEQREVDLWAAKFRARKLEARKGTGTPAPAGPRKGRGGV